MTAWMRPVRLLTADARTYVPQCLKSSLLVKTTSYHGPHKAARHDPEMTEQQPHLRSDSNGQNKSTISLNTKQMKLEKYSDHTELV